MGRNDGFLRMGLAAATCLLSSCAVTSRDFIDHASGYAITRGKVIEFEDLQSDSRVHFPDGLATLIGSQPCRITLKMGEYSETFVLPSGSVLVLTGRDDFILIPHRLNTPPRWQGSADSAASEVAPDPAVVGPPEPVAVISEEDFVAGLAEAFRSPEAEQAFRKGQGLLEENQETEALEALQLAYNLEPENSRITSILTSLLKQLGLEFYCQGNSQEAISFWKRVLEIRPGDSEARRFLKRARSVTEKL